jgi:transposase
MMEQALAAEIVRLYHSEHWPVGTIARQLRLHHSTVRRVLAQAGRPAAAHSPRPSMIEPYVGFITETLSKFPSLRASRLYTMVKGRGYPGGPDHFRALIAQLRPRPPAEAYLRLRTLPGEQAQCVWAHFGKIAVGRAERLLMAFVMVLSYSRLLFVRFYLDAAMANFLRGHVEAFSFYASVPRTVLYDNLRSAVLERVGEAIRFNPMLLELAAHYRFQPRPVAVGRGNEKGRVERAIRFAREAFFAGRAFRDLADLNAQALAWCSEAAQRPSPEDRRRSVQELFAQERPHLLELPATPFPTEERLEVSVQKTPYVRFDLNDYSVPHAYVQRTLTVLATLDTVRIVDQHKLIATHPRSFDAGAQIEDPRHIEALSEEKRAARAHRAQDRLHRAAPSATALFLRAAQRGAHMGVLTRGLLALLESHGASALEAAIVAALTEDAAHLGAVRHFIDRHAHARGAPPPIALHLPDDPRLHPLSVPAQPLQPYERLSTTELPDESHPDSSDCEP